MKLLLYQTTQCIIIVNSNIQLAQTFQFTVTHEFARALYSTVRGEENDYFQIEIIFKKGPEPSKKGDKKDGKKDKGKAKKDSKGNLNMIHHTV